jgi:aspartyl-tRNA(Asn)/glutamyl-tRNA(Gln) amidotransferase subunit C
MALDRATVANIAKLARIKVPEGELDGLADELSKILGWIEQLNEVDVEGVAPMTSVVEVDLPVRADVITDGGYPEKVVANAPETHDHYFVVPKVIE